jgi:spore maturation protein A
MSWIWFGMIAASLIFSAAAGRGSAVTSALTNGAQSAITLSLSMAGSLCLWTGVGRLMEKSGLTSALAGLIGPLLRKIFPSTKKDAVLAGELSSNICANLLGLGNAATPMGIQAAEHLAKGTGGVASDELCRLIVLNTASIQLIPSTVAALRASLGCSTPFDILPAVWVTSLCSAGLGLTAAWLLGKVWR